MCSLFRHQSKQKEPYDRTKQTVMLDLKQRDFEFLIMIQDICLQNPPIVFIINKSKKNNEKKKQNQKKKTNQKQQQSTQFHSSSFLSIFISNILTLFNLLKVIYVLNMCIYF